MAGFKGMLASPDIIMKSDEVLSVDDVKTFAGGNAAIAVFTTRSAFEYKGTPNDDIAKVRAGPRSEARPAHRKARAVLSRAHRGSISRDGSSR